MANDDFYPQAERIWELETQVNELEKSLEVEREKAAKLVKALKYLSRKPDCEGALEALEAYNAAVKEVSDGK